MHFLTTLTIFVSITLAIGQTGVGSCATNPFIYDFQNFVIEMNNQDLNVLQTINDYLKGEPVASVNYFLYSSQNKDKLVICTQFKQSSCCSLDFEKSLASIASLYNSNRREESFPFTIIMQTLQTAIQTCGVRDQSTFQDILHAPISGLQDAIKQYRINIAQILLYNTRFIRGNICTLCVPPAQYGDLFNQRTDPTQPYFLKLVLDKTSYDQYITDMAATFDNLQGQVPIFSALLQKYFTEYADTTKCASILIKLTDYMSNLQFCVGGNCAAHIKQRVNVFNQEIDEELIYIIKPDFGFTQQALNQNRLLSEEDSFVISTTGGIKTYILDDSDSKIQYQGVNAYTVVNTFSQLINIQLLAIVMIIFT